jgi:3-oxoacyl-[acyl-carrier-protein] synthase II
VRRVAVTGLGVISPLGNAPASMFERLMTGESGIRTLTIDGPRGRYSNIAAPAAFDPAAHFPVHKIDGMDRVTQFAVASARAAIADAAFAPDAVLTRRTGVAIGTGMGAAHTLESGYVQLLDRDPDRVKPLTVLIGMNNAPAAHVAIEQGLGGPNLTYSCACSSSAVAIGEALRQIRHGYADAMLAGGVEALLTYSMFKAWDALRVLALPDRDRPSASCRPFAKNRSGLVLGEGAAMVVLEEWDRAVARGARIYAELAGYGSSNDPGHITKPSVAGQAQAMQLALEDAGLTPDAIGYLNAHGTATQLNDVTETRAIHQVFGAHAARLPVSSTKSMHGHLLGGAGALEFAIVVEALRQQAVPPTAHLEVPDPECDLDYVPNTGRTGQDLGAAMSNSFAFGGTNAVLIARRPA